MPIINPMPPEFEFPRNLNSLTEAQREDLHHRFVAHNRTTDDWDTVETSPSRVIDTQDPESVRRAENQRLRRSSNHRTARDLRPGVRGGSNVGGAGGVFMGNDQEESQLHDPMADQLRDDEERNRDNPGGNFDPELGYIVAGEDPRFLSSRLPPEQMAAMFPQFVEESRARVQYFPEIHEEEYNPRPITGRRASRANDDVIVNIEGGESQLHDPWEQELREHPIRRPDPVRWAEPPRRAPRRVDDPCNWRTYAERDAEERFGDL